MRLILLSSETQTACALQVAQNGCSLGLTTQHGFSPEMKLLQQQKSELTQPDETVDGCGTHWIPAKRQRQGWQSAAEI